MKTTTLFLFIILSLKVFSQTYPFTEGFEGMPNTQIPTGWGGSMKVLSNHGINDYKAVCARVSSGVVVDSSITPLVGPLTSASALSFYYRIIDQANYPSTPTNLDAGSQIEVLLSTDSVNYNVIQLIDMNNHNSSFNFAKKKIFLSQYAGSNVLFKFRCTYGTGASFFVDIDTVRAADDPQADVNEVTGDETFILYPNPCPKAAVCKLEYAGSPAQPVKVFNAIGEEIYNSESFAYSSLPAAYWHTGLYFVQLGNTTRKLIIE